MNMIATFPAPKSDSRSESHFPQNEELCVRREIEFSTEWQFSRLNESEHTEPHSVIAIAGSGFLAAAIGRAAIAAGHSIILTDVDGPAGRALADELVYRGGQADFIATDTLTDRGVERFMEFISQHSPCLHTLVCVGACRWKDRNWFEFNHSDLMGCFRQHVLPATLLVNAALRTFFEEQGFGTVIMLCPGRWFGASSTTEPLFEMTTSALDSLANSVSSSFSYVRSHLLWPDNRTRGDMCQRHFLPSVAWNSPEQVAKAVLLLANGATLIDNSTIDSPALQQEAD
jgi:NAD(P)-dependent dehydrogenase (short-subunit alcohol dehydrogenase family)